MIYEDSKHSEKYAGVVMHRNSYISHEYSMQTSAYLSLTAKQPRRIKAHRTPAKGPWLPCVETQFSGSRFVWLKALVSDEAKCGHA